VSADRGTRTWAVLGLLGVSTAATIGWFGCLFWFHTPRTNWDILVSALLWLSAMGPHVGFGYAIWRGGQNASVAGITLAYVIPLTGISIALLAIAIIHRDVTPYPGLFFLANLIWIVGWPLGLLALVVASRQPRSPPPEDED
jgi:hypothetical protein